MQNQHKKVGDFITPQHNINQSDKKDKPEKATLSLSLPINIVIEIKKEALKRSTILKPVTYAAVATEIFTKYFWPMEDKPHDK